MNDKSSLSGLSHIAKLTAENEGLKAKLARLHELTDCPPDRTLEDWARVLEAVWREHGGDADEIGRLRGALARLIPVAYNSAALYDDKWPAIREAEQALAGPNNERGD